MGMKAPLELPRISVVTPSYNQARFLHLTVASVVGQRYPDLEYIVQDGGSTDGTRAILESLPPTVTWVSERDSGQADAVNRGWEKASGEVLGWVNSDDLYEPGTLRRVGEAFASDPKIEWLVGRCRVIDESGKEIRRTITLYKNLLLNRLSLKLLLLENPISQMAVFLRRRALEAVGPLRAELHYTMDYDLWIRLMRRSRPRILRDVLASFRVHESSKSSSGFQQQFREEHRVAAEHAQAAGLGYLVPLRRLTTGKTLAGYAALRAIARLRRAGQESARSST
jgi:glycosyltransferase involved in cell wall biosynthesis